MLHTFLHHSTSNSLCMRSFHCSTSNSLRMRSFPLSEFPRLSFSSSLRSKLFPKIRKFDGSWNTIGSRWLEKLRIMKISIVSPKVSSEQVPLNFHAMSVSSAHTQDPPPGNGSADQWDADQQQQQHSTPQQERRYITIHTNHGDWTFEVNRCHWGYTWKWNLLKLGFNKLSRSKKLV